MARFVGTTVIIFSLLLQAPVLAAGIAVSGRSPLRIAVSIENATPASAVEYLSKRYGFHVEGLQKLHRGNVVSATMTGSLQSVLGWLMRDCNYVIVQSSENENGIVKVMIFNSAVGARSPTGLAGVAINKPLAQVPFLNFPTISDRAALPPQRYKPGLRPHRAPGWGIGG